MFNLAWLTNEEICDLLKAISNDDIFGRNEGISSMSSLLAKLYAQGRSKDVERAVSDSEYLKQLFAEYNM